MKIFQFIGVKIKIKSNSNKMPKQSILKYVRNFSIECHKY